MFNKDKLDKVLKKVNEELGKMPMNVEDNHFVCTMHTQEYLEQLKKKNELLKKQEKQIQRQRWNH